MRNNRIRSIGAVLLLLLCLAGFAAAQTQAINGSIRGRVTDAGGASVPAATVDVTNDDTGFARSATSSDDGYFVLPNLPLGTYTVVIQKTGFQTQRHPGVVLDAGTEGVVDAKMEVGSVSTTVDVTGGAEVIEPSRLNTGRTIDHDEVDNLPLPSRNPYNFIIFQPGVSGHPNPELGIPRTLNTNGLLDRINYQMDGMVNTETDRYGLRLFPISDIYVREIQTVSNSFAPEFGQTGGIIFNVITNSGTNTPHGEFYFIGRPPGSSARTLLLAANKDPLPIDLHDYAVNSSGAIIKNKLFIFGGYEHLLRGLPVANTISPTEATQIGLSLSLLNPAPAVQHAQFVNIRADYVVNSKTQVFVRYNYFRNEYPFNGGAGGTNSLDASSDFHDRAHILGLQVLTTFTPTLLNEWRGSIPYRNEIHVPTTIAGPGPQINISSPAVTFNGAGAAGGAYAEKIPSFSDSLTWIRGPHTFKTGFGFQQNNDNQQGDAYSRYVFPSPQAYLDAKNGVNPKSYTSFTLINGTPGAAYKSNYFDAFLQDSWQIRPNVLLMYGVRWDRFQAPPGNPNAAFVWTRNFTTPSKDFAPRIGIAWSINPKTVMRINSGMFYEATPTNLWYNALNSASTNTATYTLGPNAAGAPAFPSVILGGGAVATPAQSIIVTAPSIKNAYTINTGIQIARQISNNDSITIGYVHTGARNLEYLRNMNLINPVSFLADGRPVFSTAVNANTRLFPQWNSITEQDSGARSNYDALIAFFTHRVTQGITFNANYTYSHTISDAPDANSFEQNVLIEDPTNRERDRGNSIVNRPNAFTATAVLNPSFKFANKPLRMLANGNELTLAANISSGDQQNITASPSNLNGDTAGGQRPVFVARDTLRMQPVFQLDARYTRTIFSFRERLKVKLLAEGSNITNHRNYSAYSNTAVPTNSAGIPTYPTAFLPAVGVLEGRLIQVGIRTDW